MACQMSCQPHSSLNSSCASGGISFAITVLIPNYRRVGQCFPTNSLSVSLEHFDLSFGLAHVGSFFDVRAVGLKVLQAGRSVVVATLTGLRHVDTTHLRHPM